MKQKIQLIEKEVKISNEIVRISEELDKDFDKLVGIAILDTVGKGHLLRSFSVAGKEVLPKDFEVAFIQSDSFIAPNERFFKLNEIAKGRTLEIEFSDSGAIGAVFPYNLKIYLLLENE